MAQDDGARKSIKIILQELRTDYRILREMQGTTDRHVETMYTTVLELTQSIGELTEQYRAGQRSLLEIQQQLAVTMDRISGLDKEIGQLRLQMQYISEANDGTADRQEAMAAVCTSRQQELADLTRALATLASRVQALDTSTKGDISGLKEQFDQLTQMVSQGCLVLKSIRLLVLVITTIISIVKIVQTLGYLQWF